MKRELLFCDLCEKEIEDAPFILKAHEPSEGKEKWKKIGCDMVLTPRGDRFYAGQAMMRVNASFYCGVNPGERDEFHFHSKCMERAIYSRLSQFLFQKSPEEVKDDD